HIRVRRSRTSADERAAPPPYARRVRSERAAVSDVPWLVPLGAVVLLGTWFTNVDEGSHTGPVAATLCAAAAVAGLVVTLRVPRVGPLVTSAAVTTFVLLDATE